MRPTSRGHIKLKSSSPNDSPAIQFNYMQTDHDLREMREGIKKFSNWPTIPQLYVKEEFIGGCDIVKEMNESGELLELFNSKGINVSPT